MERSAWPDQRLDDRFDRIDGELAALRQDVRDLRGEMRDMGGELRGDMRGLEGSLRGEIREVRSMLVRLHFTMLITFVGVIATILARGA